MTISEYIDRIETFTESARAEYEISCILNEAADKKVTPKGNVTAPKKSFMAKIGTGIKKLWEIIKALGRAILNAIMKIARLIKTGNYVAEVPLQYDKILLKRAPAVGELTPQNASKYLRTLKPIADQIGTKVTIKVGEKVSPNLVANAETWGKLAATMKVNLKKAEVAKEGVDDLHDTLAAVAKITNVANNFIAAIGKKDADTGSYSADYSKATDKTGKKFGKDYVDVDTLTSRRERRAAEKLGIQNNSAEDVAYLRARLLIEAADALADSSEDAGDPLPAVDEYDPAKDTISEIEDDVVEGEDYVPEVSGGDDDETYPSDDDLEELEDLLDDDDDAMEIMTERDGTETIDAEPTVESILNFDL